ncbi:RNA-binding protein 6 isoform X1 [Pangasianodon hypophthalmus]|uniref:RNA-binding protein 6 isoform X1 n=1 Tax=Pangasianodon hypophthalmus TaxID=310915 RepID=UPI002307A77D|nr:RNA-binding protein 6 isoform X1 [Pangasianodon hypophthalmus]
MWNGSRSGPRGGMPFCGDPRGEMFEGRNGPMPGFRGREGMNMGAQDRPPMDMRRFDYPPDMVGRNMGLLDRGRDSPRDFFMPENEVDFRRRFEMEQNTPGYIGQGRPPIEMGGRDMQVRNMRGPEDQFMDMRERDRFRMDMPGFNMSPMDIRRRLAMESMDRNDHIRERERSQMGMNDIDGFSMDMPPRERSADFDRRGCAPPLTPRGRFESDMDFRNRMGPSGDFRDRSPQMFRGNDGMNLRGRPDLPLDRQGPEKDMLQVGEPTLRDREFPEQNENRSGFRGEDGKSLSEEWCRRMNRSSNLSREVKKRFPPGLGKEGELGEPSQFKDRERPSVEIPTKDRGTLEFSRSEREGPTIQSWDKIQTDVPGRDPSHSVPQKLPLLPLNPSLNIPSKDKDSQHWSRDEKPDSTVQSGGRHPFFPEKGLSVKESHFSVDQGNFKGKDMPLDEGQKKGNIMPGPRDPPSNREGRRDQDYGDIDYRTSSAQKYDYILEDLQRPEKNTKSPKSAPPERSNASGSQDQDYRNASVQDKISNTIAISGIPKTATMQQILDAFAVRDGVPMQGMKIKDVVPGYSSDTAYVEFLNIEDAVHFMESNQGSVKVGSKTALLKYIQPDRNAKEPQHEDQPHKAIPSTQDGLLPCPVLTNPPKVKEEGCAKTLNEPLSQGGWQRSSTLTPEAWQQQVDKQLQQQEMEKRAEEWAHQRGPRSSQQFTDPIFRESKTMIIKNILPTTSVETILRSLDPFAYLDERNVRLVKGKTPGSKCFCFVDMDSHEHVTRLVDLLTKPRPIMIDGVRVYAEVAKPLKNQNYRKDYDKSNTSLLGYPPDVMEQQQQYINQSHTAISTPTQGMGAPADPVHTDSSLAAASLQGSGINQGAVYAEPSVEATEQQIASSSDPAHTGSAGGSEDYSYGSDTPDLSAFLYDATSGFYYDPQTTLYYDPNSRYFYNAQTQQYLYWDSTSKIYIPVEGEGSGTDAQKPNAPVEAVAETAAAEELKMPSEGAPERREDEEATPRSEKKEKEKEDKPRSLAAFKIMKDMERWAKIQNRQKDSVRAPSPILRTGAEEKKTSKAADAAFAVFERKTTGGDDLFKKPLAPPRKEEKGSKKPMGSLGMLAADYAAGSDEEEEEKHEKHEAPAPPPKSQPEPQEKEDKLTDWKKMACLLCRRQFPSKDALIRHQQLSDLHKQNMEIHLKIKKSKRELEALENQEKEMHMRETHSPPEAKKRKQQSTWPSSSRDTHKGNERPGLGLESTERHKKEAVVWNNATYKQAVRKAMFARFKELE